MAYQNTYSINNVNVTCDHNDGTTQLHDWLLGHFKIEINANSSNTAYDVKVYAQMTSSVMQWTGDATLRVTCNGVTRSVEMGVPLNATNTSTGWSSPATFSFGTQGTTSLTFNIDLDLTKTLGSYGGAGPSHESNGYYVGDLQHFYVNNYTVTVGDGGVPPLLKAPTISSLTNTSQLNSQSGVSSSTNSISIKWTESGTVSNRYYKIDNGSWTSASSSTITISNLSAGTSYRIYVKSSNSAGDSNTLDILIRTKYAKPTIKDLINTNTHNSQQGVSASTNNVSFSWTVDSGVVSTHYYKVNGGNWVEITNPYYKLTELTQGTTYNIQVKSANSDDESAVLSLSIRTKWVNPTISDLVNTNKYNNSAGVSASTNSISFSWSESGTVTKRYYRINSGTWTEITSASGTKSSLTAGTSYTLDVKSANVDGESAVLSTTIRTRHNIPVLTLTFDSKTLESLNFRWTSDKDLQSTEYKINDGNWVTGGAGGTSGNCLISGLDPNTTYTLYFRGTSTSSYDSLTSDQKSSSGKTLDMAHITSIGTCTFGVNISVSISHVATNNLKLKIWTEGNSRTAEFTYTSNVNNGTFTFAPTQEQLDNMYRCFTDSNSVPIYFQLTTIGQKEWNDTRQDKTLQLTGIAKTINAGIDDLARRGQAWTGDNNYTPRRAIIWVGVDDKPKRCI